MRSKQRHALIEIGIEGVIVKMERVMGLKLIGSAVALLSASTAYATDWRMIGPVGKAPSRKAFFIDRSSVQKIGNDQRVWVQVINETLDSKSIKSMKMLIQLDCGQRRERTLAIIVFGPLDIIGNKQTPGDWSYIAPDSPINSISDAVCNNNYTDTIASPYPPEMVAQATFDVLDNNGHVKAAPGRHR